MVVDAGYKPVWPRYFVLACGVLITLWSLIVVAGLYSHNQALLLFATWSAPITINTALSCLLCGGGLIALSFDFLRTVRVFGLFIVLLTVLSVLQDYSGLDLGFDHFIYSPLVDFGHAVSVKMAVNSAACFFLVGTSFLFINGLEGFKNGPLFLGIVCSLILALATLATIGYLSGTETAYAWSERSGMSVACAIAFLLTGLSLLFYNWTLLHRSNNQFLWLSLPISIGLFATTCGFATALWIEQKKAADAAEIAEGTTIRDGILRDTLRGVDSLEHMVKIWAFSAGTPRPLWEEEGRLVISQVPGLQEILWVNANDKPAWIVGNHDWLKLDVLLNEKIMQAARTERSHAIGGVYDDNGSLIGMSVYLPIYFKDQFDGYIVGVFDIKKFIQSSLANESDGKYKISIVHSGNDVLNINPPLLTNQPNGVHIPLNLMGLSLDISVKARGGILGNREPLLPVFVVLSGLFTVLLTSFLIYYALKAMARAKERERAVLMLRRANDTIIEQDKLVSLGTLTAGIAHEVKNPLNIIKSFSELSLGLVEEVIQTLQRYTQSFKAEDRDKLNDALGTLKVNLVRVCEQSKRSNNIIQRMLAHTRGNQETSLTDIHCLLDEYLNLSYYGIRAQDPSINIKITKRYDVSAPKIEIIAEDMSRVFLNLFNNAYYALAQKKKGAGTAFAPELIITTLSIDGRFEIRIRDNGCGIPETVSNKIFTPFFTTKPVGMGTGLGLSLSHAIVIDHGGTLDFVSKEGEFTEFHITLPIKKSAPIDLHRELSVRL